MNHSTLMIAWRCPSYLLPRAHPGQNLFLRPSKTANSLRYVKVGHQNSRLCYRTARCTCATKTPVSASDLRGHRDGSVQQGDFSVAELVDDDEEIMVGKRTVAVFWDLDNKPPNLVPAYDAAIRLKALAGDFGDVVSVVAYANQNAFSYVPARVREERQDRKMLDQLERRGVMKAENPYLCRMCGRKFKTNLLLKKHFKQLHERERNKRMTFLKQLRGKKRGKFLDKVATKEAKYKEIARNLIIPKVGYGLASELKRAGVTVRTVEKKPQAADVALLRHMNLYIHKGIECILLVSDDSDFMGILKTARLKNIYTIVIGDTATLRGVANTWFSWADVVSGGALLSANNNSSGWASEDMPRAELLGQEDPYFSDGDEEEFLEFQRSLRSTVKISAFGDEEDYSSYLDGEEALHDEPYCGLDGEEALDDEPYRGLNGEEALHDEPYRGFDEEVHQ